MNLELRLFDIPIRLRIWFVPTAFLLGILNPEVGASPARMGIWMLVLGSAILAHELGHAFAAKAYGWGPRIDVAFVGVTTFDRRTEVSRAKRILLVVLGPLVGLAIGAMAHSALVNSPLPRGSLAWFTLDAMRLVNLAWGLGNLVPILPLDGGHVVAELASAVFPKRGLRIAATWSIVVCVVAGFVAAYVDRFDISLFAALLAFRNHRILDLAKRSQELVLSTKPRDLAYLALTRNDAMAVVEHAGRAREEATSDAEADEASYLLAWGHFLAERPTEARTALATMRGTRPHDYALEGAIAHDLGELEESLALFERALPRATPFIEPRLVHAIVTTQRFEEASLLFDDSLGEKISPRGIATVQRAAYDAGRDRESIGIGETLFRKTRDASVAFLLACANSRLGELEAGLLWLRRARERGFDRREVLDVDPALAPLRALPEWGELRESFDAA